MRLRFHAPPLFLLAVCGCGLGGAGGPATRPVPEVGPSLPPAGADLVTTPPLPVWEPEFGQRVRATVGTFPPMAGEVRAITSGVLLLQGDQETFPLRLTSIRVLEVRRHRRTRALEGGIFGALAGAVLGRVTLVGIGGDHWASQGEILAPGLGAILGGLVGALLGWQIGGDYWEQVGIPASAGLAPRRIVGGRSDPELSLPGWHPRGPADVRLGYPVGPSSRHSTGFPLLLHPEKSPTRCFTLVKPSCLRYPSTQRARGPTSQ